MQSLVRSAPADEEDETLGRGRRGGLNRQSEPALDAEDRRADDDIAERSFTRLRVQGPGARLRVAHQQVEAARPSGLRDTGAATRRCRRIIGLEEGRWRDAVK